jgi:hypothetical protein
MEINVAVVGDDANEGKERRKAMSLPDLTKKSIKSITVVDSIESVSVVVGEERKQRWEEGSVEREGWEEGESEEISRRLQFYLCSFGIRTPRSGFSNVSMALGQRGHGPACSTRRPVEGDGAGPG